MAFSGRGVAVFPKNLKNKLKSEIFNNKKTQPAHNVVATLGFGCFFGHDVG